MHEILLPFKKLNEVITDALFPTECPICGNQKESFGICENCRNALTLMHEDIEEFELDVEGFKVKCASCFSYKNDAVKKLILYLKKNDSKRIISFVSMHMSAAVRKVLPATNAIFTNIPRSRYGIIKHGFDQSENIARKTAEFFDNAHFFKLLKRKGFARQQKNLTSSQRKSNIKGKIGVKKSSLNLQYDSIVLFDDVITTGSSARECLKQLHLAFPEKQIYAVFLATQGKFKE